MGPCFYLFLCFLGYAASNLLLWYRFTPRFLLFPPFSSRSRSEISATDCSLTLLSPWAKAGNFPSISVLQAPRCPPTLPQLETTRDDQESVASEQVDHAIKETSRGWPPSLRFFLVLLLGSPGGWLPLWSESSPLMRFMDMIPPAPACPSIRVFKQVAPSVWWVEGLQRSICGWSALTAA